MRLSPLLKLDEAILVEKKACAAGAVHPPGWYTRSRGRRLASLRVIVLFVSSRRRHTRCLSDWSSDVCSSDLRSGWRARRGPSRCRERQRRGAARSEERRVGEECRSRWSPYQLKKG